MKNVAARISEPTTLPPPAGEEDMYSAQTRVGSLPEEVLAAMCADEADSRLPARTVSGTRRAVRPAPTPPSTALRPDTPEPFSTIRARTEPPVADAHGAHDIQAPSGPLPSALEDEAQFLSTQSFELALEPARSGLVRSIAIVAGFALLGGLVAYAIMLVF